MLTFSEANAKLQALSGVRALEPYLTGGRRVYSFDLPAGWSCPAALLCLSKVTIRDGQRRVIDGPQMEHRCYPVTAESAFTSVYDLRHRNFAALRGLTQHQITDLIGAALPDRAGIIRLHTSGDLYTRAYFRAWLEIARQYSSVLFYAYTKSLPLWCEHRRQIARRPNVVLTASYGGRHDDLIRAHRLRSVRVVLSLRAAGRLPVDHDDSHAADPTQRRRSFALLIHGTQPAGSTAAAAVRALQGVGSYTRRRS